MYTKVRVQELIVTTAWIRVLHYFMKFPNSFINDVWTWRNTRILLSLILWWVIQSGRKQKLLSNHTYHSVILTIMGGGVLLCVNLEFWLTFKYQQTKVSQWYKSGLLHHDGSSLKHWSSVYLSTEGKKTGCRSQEPDHICRSHIQIWNCY